MWGHLHFTNFNLMIKEKKIVKKFLYFVFNLVSDVVYVIGKKHTWIQKHKYSTKNDDPYIMKDLSDLIPEKIIINRLKCSKLKRYFMTFFLSLYAV